LLNRANAKDFLLEFANLSRMRVDGLRDGVLPFHNVCGLHHFDLEHAAAIEEEKQATTEGGTEEAAHE
jgi:hypothetical protein